MLRSAADNSVPHLDAVKEGQGSATIQPGKFDEYRGTSALPIAKSYTTSGLNEIAGSKDITLTDDTQNFSKVALSQGQKDFEALEQQTGFTQNKDGSYSMNGQSFQADKAGSYPDDIAQMINKQQWSDQMSKTPLDASQQKAFDAMNAAMQKGDMPELGRLASQFKNDPEGFDPVFKHLLGESVLTGRSNTYLGLGGSANDKHFTAQVGGGAPQTLVHMQA
jgi:hypothetical protein